MSETSLPQRLREEVAQRAHHCCEYCRSQESVSPDVFSIEHIHPRSRGGATTLDNLALSCQGCNGHKATRIECVDPETGGFVPLFHPRNHLWNDHFAWSEDFTRILGMTPTGRATIEALHLNRDRLINLRRVMRQAGLHPPEE